MNVLKKFYTSSTCSRRSWERLIGSLNFITQILTQSRHLLQPLLRPQLLGSTSTRDQLRPVPDQLRKALIPWMNPLILKQKETFYVDHNPVLLWTDASLTGWGGHKFFLCNRIFESNRNETAHKHSRDKSSLPHLSPAQSEEQDNPFIHRQCTSAMRNKQAIMQISESPREIVILIQTLQTRNLRIKAFRLSTILNSKADALLIP